MNLRQLEIFGAVITTGTTVGAAEQLAISQSAVSSMISHMEDQLEFKLFLRQRGRLVPTPEALLLYEKAQKIFDAFDSAQFFVDQIRGGHIGDLRIVCTPGLGLSLLPQAVARFRNSRPDVKVSIDVGSLNFVFECLEREKADLGVYFTERDHPLILRRRIIDLSILCVVPKGHALAELEVVTPKDMADYPIITLNSSNPVGALIESAFLQSGLNLERAIEVRFLFTAQELVALGQGVALVDPLMLLTAERFPDLVFRAFSPKIVTSAVVARLKTRPLSVVGRQFIEDLKAVTKGLRSHSVFKAYEGAVT